MKRSLVFVLLMVVAGCATVPPPPPTAPLEPAPAPVAAAYSAGEPRVVTLDSRAPLVTLRVMVTHGSTSEPAGKEGLAALTADAIVDGGYRNGAALVTKEQLAEMTIPWGSGARPSAFSAARTTTFFFTAPREVLPQYIRDVLRPMLNAPAFAEDEIARLKNETMSTITSLRSEDLENLGLAAIDQFVNAGTGFAHHPVGTETSVPKLTRDDVVRFYRDFYRPENIIVGISTTDATVVSQVRDAVRTMNRDATSPPPVVVASPPTPIRGREFLVIEEPNAPAASVHVGSPLAVGRNHPDYWPLYVANVWLGTHRDSFGQLYQKIREERGYNYGDYSYIEHWNGRSSSLFQVFNQPREQQYFSLWIRPVKQEHAVHLAKAVTYELEQLIRRGLTADEVNASKNKARVLYLNLGETVPRLIAARMDDAFYGSQRGFLDAYLQQIDAVTPEQVNAAIRRHLSTDNLKYVIVTNTPHVQNTVAQIRSNTAVFGKSWQEYEFTTAKLADGTTVWQIPEAKMATVQLDAAWANYALDAREVRVINVSEMFK